MLNKKLGIIALLASGVTSYVWATPPQDTITNFGVGDVLVCFRSGGNDMVVDAGQVATLTNAVHNQVITINKYTGTQLAAVGTNSVSWSAFAWEANNTLFVTRARANEYLQSSPWLANNSQSGVAAQMATIPPGALDELNELIYPVSTPSAVVEENNSDDNPNYPDGQSYYDALSGSYGSDFDGTFAGSPENTTLSSFTQSATPVISDFYQMNPTTSFNSKGTWLGYFQFNTNGVMTYVAYPNSTPVISSVTRTGTVSTITYNTGIYGTYNLLATNNISAPVSTWPVVSVLSTGDNLSHSVQDTDLINNNKYYIIQGQ